MLFKKNKSELENELQPDVVDDKIIECFSDVEQRLQQIEKEHRLTFLLSMCLSEYFSRGFNKKFDKKFLEIIETRMKFNRNFNKKNKDITK